MSNEIRKPKAPKYLAYTETDGIFEFFDNYADAVSWLEEGLIDDGAYQQEVPEGCGIYALHTGVEIEVIAKRSECDAEQWEEMTSHIWQSEDEVGEIMKHKFVKIN